MTEGKAAGNNEEAIDAFLSLIITGAVAPVIAHALEVLCGPGGSPWTTDRLLILLFSSMSGLIIAQGVKQTVANFGTRVRIFSKGIESGDFNLVSFVFWVIPVWLVNSFYNTMLCVVVVACYLVAAAVLLAQKPLLSAGGTSMTIYMIAASLLAAITAVAMPFLGINMDASEGVTLIIVVVIIVSSAVTCVVSCLITHAYFSINTALKERRKK